MIFMHQRSGCKKYAESLRFILIVFILMIAEASRSGSGNYNSRRGVTRRTISNSSRASPNPERIQSEIDSDPWVIVYPQTLPEQQLQQRTIGYGYGEVRQLEHNIIAGEFQISYIFGSKILYEFCEF